MAGIWTNQFRVALTHAIVVGVVHFNSGDASAAPLKVMPLGDSITAGSPFEPEGGYRTRLWQRFGSDPAKLDFLGSLFGGPAMLGDKSHEGHIGFSIAADPLITFGNITDNIARYLKGGRAPVIPDVILLMIGTNDVNYDAALAPGAPGRLSHLISLISDPTTGLAPQAKLIVSSILPIDDARDNFRATPGDFSRNARVVAFNAALPVMIAGHRANGEQVYLADINARFTFADMIDGLHPSLSGYQKLGDAWYDAIQAVLVPEPSTGTLATLVATVCFAGRSSTRSKREESFQVRVV